MAIKTTVILIPTRLKNSEDIVKFSSPVSTERILELIKHEEAHLTSEQLISDIKMHRFERSESCPEKSNAMPADSNGRSARKASTTK